MTSSTLLYGESISATFNYSYFITPLCSHPLPAGCALHLSGTFDLEENSSKQVIGVTNIKITITGGGNPSETFTSGTIQTVDVNGKAAYHELILCGSSCGPYTRVALEVLLPGDSGNTTSCPIFGPLTQVDTACGYDYGASSPPVTTATNGGNPITACFTAGTMVLTPAGEVPIETLKIGDLVTLSDGRAVPMTWMGIKTVATRFADPLRVLPVRIRAGALGDDLPKRDMLISPDHAILIGEFLVQAGALVNDLSVTREHAMAETFNYYHVEVAGHDLLMVENLAVETFVDNVDRMGFDNWAEHETLYGNAPAIAEMDLPRIKSARQIPSAIRHQLLARGEAMYGMSLAA